MAIRDKSSSKCAQSSVRGGRSMLVLALAAVLLLAGRSNAQQFYDMGSLNNWESAPRDITPDGRVVVGWSSSAAPGDSEAVVWTREEGLVALSAPPNTPSPTFTALAISDDGNTIVGHAGVIESPAPTPIVWHNRVPSMLPTTAGTTHGRAYDISGDGRLIVGKVNNGTYNDTAGVVWTDGVPAPPIHTVPEGHTFASLISRDGGTIVYPYGASNDRDYRCDGVTCTPLLPPPGMKVWTLDDISADGAVVVGNVYTTNLRTAVPARWFEGVDAPQVLASLPGWDIQWVWGVSPDGNTVFGDVARFDEGDGWSESERQAWRWTPTGGYEFIKDMIQAAGLGVQLTGWEFGSALASSDDGKVIIGVGKNPSGIRRGWIADFRNAPPNDRCDSPISIAEPLFSTYTERRTTGTTEDATSDGASTCGFGGGPDVWYEFSAPESGYLELSVCGSGLLNPVISVHRGCPGGSATQVFCATDCDDAGCDGACIDPPWVPIEPGEKYLVRVASDPSVPGGLFTLVTRFLPHADDCADAPLLTNPSTTGGVTTLATISPAERCGDFPHTAPGVWYRVIGTGTTMTASLCGAADYDTRMTLYCGGCENPTCLTQDDDGCLGELTSEITWCSAPGQQYYLLVHGYGSQTGTFDLSISSSGGPCGFTWNCSPDNDDCAGALPLSTGTTLVDNGPAQTVLGGTACAGIGNDLWHSYTPTCSGDVLIDTCQSELGTLSDTVLSVLGGCGGVEVGCNDDYDDGQLSCGRRSVVEVRATAGRELLIRNGGYQTFQETGTYPLRVTEVPDPVSVPDWWIDAPQAAPIAFDIGISGGCPPFITEEGNGYFVTASGLPEGLAVDSYGLLYGAHPYSGVYQATIDVADREITTPGDTGTFDFRFVAVNDDCAQPTNISEGSYPFGTHTLTTDGPAELEACAQAGLQTIDRDQWFRYQSSCDGIATIDVCEGALDATVAVYAGGDCPSAPSAVICDHPACGTAPRPRLRVEREAEYLIRVGGYAGAEDNGVLTVTCFNDCNENEVSDEAEIDALSGPFRDGDNPADCNGNRRLDVCESVADANGDGFVSSADWISMRACLTAPCALAGCAPSMYTRECCGRFDVDSDGDVDMGDAAEWIRTFENAASN